MESASVPYGRRLVPNVIDETAQHEPHREAFQIPRSEEARDGWEVITFKHYANAINVRAHAFVKLCGKPRENTFPTLAYIGPQDARYVVFMVAAMKAGFKALFVSQRNSVEGQKYLFAQTDCRAVFCPETFVPVVESWELGNDMRVFQVGPLDDWFPAEEVPHFQYDKTFEQAEWEPLCVLHTSGSTGLPKPITARNGMIAIGDACHHLDTWQGYTHWVRAWAEKSKRHFVPMPLFHAAALYVFIINVIWWKTPIALGLGDRPLTADLIMDCLDHLDVESAVLPPSILEDMSNDEKCIVALRKLKLIPIAGGGLAREVGDHMSHQGVTLCNLLNSTEFTPFPLYFQSRPELWQYFIINPDLFGCDWRKADDDAYELVIVRKAEHPGMQGFFYTFPELYEFSTNDLYKPHPTLPHHWIYHGRADNVIVFSNGEKLNPVTIESIVQGHPEVKGALVVGANRFQPGLLIEPLIHPQNGQETGELIDRVWPFVARANNDTSAHGQISRDFIAVLGPGKSFARAGKGTVQRAATLSEMRDEIDLLYTNADIISHEDAPVLDLRPEALPDSLVTILAPHLRTAGLDLDTNFFLVGMDSLQVMNAYRRLRAGLAAAGHTGAATSLAARAIYSNPTPRRLSQYILKSVAQDGNGVELEQDEGLREVDTMKALHEKYASNLIESRSARPDASRENQTILLTGSTGALGSYLLDRLSRSPAVGKIICLNRAQDGGFKQQAKAMKDRGLTPRYAEKAEFHRVDMADTRLGLSDDTYSRLLREADCIILNAWPVNFNLSTDSFEPNLHGVRQLCDLAATATKRAMVLFISSISVAAKWDPSLGPVAEDSIEDLSLPSNGYGRSKLIGSMIVDAAGRAGDFPAVSIRMGQIAGPELGGAGAWNRNEWFPSIVESSLHLSALPCELGRADRVDWIPIERAAALVAEVAGADVGEPYEATGGYFHGVNPAVTTWQELAPAVKDFYGDRIKEMVTFEEWVGRLEGQATDDAVGAEANPGLKLIDTYRSMLGDPNTDPVIFDTSRTCSRSLTLRTSQAVTAELVKHWCKQWSF